MPLLLALVALQSDAGDLKLQMKRFDRITVAITVKTEVSASDGRDSKWTAELEILYECDKAEGAAILLDGYVQSAKSSGTVRGREFSHEWRKNGTARTTGQRHAALATLEQPFKVKLDARGEVAEAGLDEYLETFPVFSPAALVGLPCPLGSGDAWKAPPRRYTFYSGFALAYDGKNSEPKAATAKLFGRLKFTAPDTEVPVEGMMSVKGKGDSYGEFDVKTKRPLKGLYSVTVTSGQGGLRREVTQTAEWTVK